MAVTGVSPYDYISLADDLVTFDLASRAKDVIFRTATITVSIQYDNYPSSLQTYTFDVNEYDCDSDSVYELFRVFSNRETSKTQAYTVGEALYSDIDPTGLCFNN